MMNVELKVKCRVCKEVKAVEMTLEESMRVEAGQELIQDILPDHSADERELLMSHICGTCYDKMFGEG